MDRLDQSSLAWSVLLSTSDDWTEGGGDRHNDGGDEDGDDDAPVMEYIG